MNRAEVRKRALHLLKYDKDTVNEYSGPTEWGRALVAVLCLEYNEHHEYGATYKGLCKYFNFPRVYETNYGFDSMLIELYGKKDEGKILTNE